MKYNPPFGSIDPDAPYVDRNTPGAIKGSAVPAAAIEDPQREIVRVIEAAGFQPSDEMQLATAIQSGRMNFAEAAGTPNALTAAIDPAPLSLVAVMATPITVRTGEAANTNGMTLNLNTLGTRPIVHRDGSAIAPGEVPPNSFLNLMYDGEKFIAYAVALPAVGLSFATREDAELGNDNTKPMTPLRSNEARQQPRAAIPSAATTDLATVSSQDVFVTGNASISSFGNGRAGICRRLSFEGSLAIVHSTSLFLPNNGQQITTEQGDSCEALSLGGGAWVIYSYQRARGYNPIGDRQTWQGLLGSRSANTAYQNTTGRTIMVAIGAGNANVAKSFEVSPDGSNWLEIGYGIASSGSTSANRLAAQGPYPIPSGHFYRVVTTDSLNLWAELR